MAAFLENMLGMEVSDTAALAFTAVALLVLLAILWLLVRFFRQPRFAGKRGKQARLAITDAARVDDRRRLVLVRRDDVEHLIMIGGVTDLLIEADIRRTAPARALSHHDDEPLKAAEPAPLPPRVSREDDKPAPVEPKAETKRPEWPAVPPASRPAAPAHNLAPAVSPASKPAAPAPNPAPVAPVSQPVVVSPPASIPPIPKANPAILPMPPKVLTDPAAIPAKAASSDPSVDRPAPTPQAPVQTEPAKRTASDEMEALLSGLKPTR